MYRQDLDEINYFNDLESFKKYLDEHFEEFKKASHERLILYLGRDKHNNDKSYFLYASSYFTVRDNKRIHETVYYYGYALRGYYAQEPLEVVYAIESENC